ncbi:MAG: hypothetical protein IT343_04615 [Candidatus Melainabacteria bacterium]|nr:hypothetical protein [Candidatus Melainabacteria bacterium]
MTFGGKNLQEVYDGGSKSMTELEAELKAKLKNLVDSHAEGRRSDEEKAVGKVEERFSEFEADLRKVMDATVQRIKDSMQEEINETEKHVHYLNGELKLVADKLRGTIVELKRAHEASVNFISETATDEFEASVEESQLEIEKQDNAASKHLKAHGTFVLNSLQQKLDHCLWESRGDEKQFSGALFKTYMQRASGIDTGFSGQMQKLTAESQVHFKSLDAASQAAEQALDGDMTRVLGEIDARGKETEQTLKSEFERTSAEHAETLRQSLIVVTEGLGRTHETNTQRLNEETRELSTALVVASGEAQEALKTKCEEIRTQTDAQMQQFTQRLDEKMKQTMTSRQQLESEKDTIFATIQSELNTIRDNFEGKLTTLKDDSLTRVQTIVGETEREIATMCETLKTKMTADAQSVADELQRSIANFLSELATQKKNALDEIEVAAGKSPAQANLSTSADSGGSAAADPNQESARVRRVKRDTQ